MSEGKAVPMSRFLSVDIVVPRKVSKNGASGENQCGTLYQVYRRVRDDGIECHGLGYETALTVGFMVRIPQV